MHDKLSPVPPRERIDLLDVLRGVAVCGILVVNIVVMGTVGSTQGRDFPAGWNADWVAWGLERLFFEGSMRGLFTILFGAGMLMMLRTAEGDSPRVIAFDVWTRRCLTLLALGIVHFAVLMWPGEILWTYGVAGLALLAFRAARPRTLWFWALIIIACLSAFRAYDTSTYVVTYQNAVAAERALAAGEQPTAEQKAGLEAAAAARASNHPSRESLAAEVEQRTQLPSLFAWSASGWAFRHLGVYSWHAVAECLAFMLVGMALYRSGILIGAAPTRRYVRMLLLWGGIGTALRLIDFAWQARTGFELDIHRIDTLMSLARSAWYQPARLSLTLAWLALIVLLMRTGASIWAAPFRALGRTALTTYTLQSVLTSILFYGFGFVGAFGMADLMWITLGICILTAIFSMSWLRRYPIGPAEWLIRAIAYRGFSDLRRPMVTSVIAHSPPV